MRQTILGILVALAATACSGSPSSSSDTTVSPGPTPMTLRVAQISDLTKKGETAQLNALVAFSDGTTLDKTGSASWVSSKPGVATVSSTGMVTAVEDGEVVITATFQTISGSMSVKVDLPTAPAH